MKTVNSELLAKYRYVIFGLAAIWIFFRHTIHCLNYEFWEPFNWFFRFGDAGVDIFLFLSGYGLTISLSRNGNLKVFYKKRLLRLLPFCGLFILATSSIELDYHILNPLHLISKLFFNYWYIIMIFTCYAVMPLLMRIPQHYVLPFFVAIFGCSLLLITLFRFSGHENTHLNVYIARIPVFILGYVCSRLKHEPNYAMGGVSLIIGLSLMFLIPFEYKDFRRLLYIFISYGFVYTLPCVFEKLPSLTYKYISYVGKLSLEFYLIHAWIMVRLMNTIEDISKYHLYTFIIFLTTIILSVISQNIVNKIINKLHL